LRHKDQKQIEPIILVHTFEKDKLREIFHPKDIDAFYEMELAFITVEWLKDGKWIKDKNMLVSLILYLEVKLPFKKFGRKNRHSKLLACRRFFEERYGVKIRKQMQAKQIKMYDLPDKYTSSFERIKAMI
jgi:hypothetical protein